ncbi:MAG: hypothetical protein KDD29_09445, partial [Flavobacteriales bacterium]|nr:hypothetical protein [Flavobacteriales bacterium]
TKQNNARYLFHYSEANKKGCIDYVNLFLDLSIPIKLNGVKLKQEEKVILLQDIRSDQLVSIRLTYGFFKKRTLEILTQNKP